MPLNKYTITQKVNLQGTMQTRSFGINCSASDLDAVIGVLEGAIEVKQVIKTAGNADTLVESANFTKMISFYPDKTKGIAPVHLRSYDGRALIIKNTENIDELKTKLNNITPFVNFDSEKPKLVMASYSEKIS